MLVIFIILFPPGLELHGVLSLMREYPTEGVHTLIKTPPSIERVKRFYEPMLSDFGTAERPLEEIAVYNFYKFLSQVSSK